MAEWRPDVILLNVSLIPPLYPGLDLAMELLEPRPTKMILLTSLEEREVILDAFTIGVLNVVDKTNYRDIPAAVREAHHDRASIHPDAAGLLREEVRRLRQLELHCLLTPAEKQVLNLLLQDYTKKQIAEALKITMNTVKFHLRSLIRKVGGRTGKEAAEIAKRRGYK
jgi:Response regulator containing a CheY-like receiver domain and an HTH DNA-binding domain